MLPTQLATENDNNIHWTPDLHSQKRMQAGALYITSFAVTQLTGD